MREVCLSFRPFASLRALRGLKAVWSELKTYPLNLKTSTRFATFLILPDCACCIFYAPPEPPSGSGHKKALRDGRASDRSRGEVLFDLRRALELVGEFLDAAGGVDHALLTRKGRMRIHGNVTHDHEIIEPVDLLGTSGFHRGFSQKFLARSNIKETDVVESWMAFGLHGKSGFRSALARLVARLDFIDDVDAPFATDHLASRVTYFGGFDGGDDFHKR